MGSLGFWICGKREEDLVGWMSWVELVQKKLGKEERRSELMKG